MSVKTDSEPEQSVTKTVTIVGYIDDRRFGDAREWADEVDGTVDYYEQYSSDRTRHYLVGPEMKEYLTSEQYERLQETNIGDLTLKKEVETDMHYDYSPDRPVSDGIKFLFTDVLGETYNGWQYSSWSPSYKDADGNQKVTVYTTSKRMPLLKHPKDITLDDPYTEEDTEYDVVRVKLKYDVNSRRVLEMLDKDITQRVIETLSGMTGIGRVRWMDCEVQTTEKGACFNI